jgi:hypothetical protein
MVKYLVFTIVHPCAELPPDADDLFLYRTFAPLGAITSVRVMRDDAGNSSEYKAQSTSQLRCFAPPAYMLARDFQNMSVPQLMLTQVYLVKVE